MANLSNKCSNKWSKPLRLETLELGDKLVGRQFWANKLACSPCLAGQLKTQTAPASGFLTLQIGKMDTLSGSNGKKWTHSFLLWGQDFRV